MKPKGVSDEELAVAQALIEFDATQGTIEVDPEKAWRWIEETGEEDLSYFRAAAIAIETLRKLPVEDRMAAMGMTKWDDVAGYEPGTTVPVWIVRDAHV